MPAHSTRLLRRPSQSRSIQCPRHELAIQACGHHGVLLSLCIRDSAICFPWVCHSSRPRVLDLFILRSSRESCPVHFLLQARSLREEARGLSHATLESYAWVPPSLQVAFDIIWAVALGFSLPMFLRIPSATAAWFLLFLCVQVAHHRPHPQLALSPRFLLVLPFQRSLHRCKPTGLGGSHSS